MANMNDVAKKAGVSRGTVSNYINNVKILILIDYKKITKKCQKSNARESILSRFYKKVI